MHRLRHTAGTIPAEISAKFEQTIEPAGARSIGGPVKKGSDVVETALKRGEVVPNFTLPNTAGEMVRRSAYRGKQHLILLFMPATEEETARAYLQSIANAYSAIKAASGDVLALFRDSMETLAEVKETLALPFQLLSDDGTAMLRFVPPDAHAGVFVIDRYGELYFSAVAQDTQGLPPVSELQSWLEAVDNQCSI